MFHDLEQKTKRDADEVMNNFTHVNYGNDIVPVDSDGVAVDEVQDMGTPEVRWRDVHLSGSIHCVVPSGSLRRNNDGSLGRNALVTLGWDIVDEDVGGMVNGSAGFKAPDTGFYMMTGQVVFASTSSGTKSVFIMRDGTTVYEKSFGYRYGKSTGTLFLPFTYFGELGKDNQVSLALKQTSGGTIRIYASNFYWSCHMLGGA